MAYDRNGLSLLTGGLPSRAYREWALVTDDTAETALAAGYISNATEQGMRAGDGVTILVREAGDLAVVAKTTVVGFSGNAANLALVNTIDVTGGSSGLLREWAKKSTAYTARSGDRILADTTAGAWTLTLPASPVDGTEVWVQDWNDTFATNNLTIGRNGSTIGGVAADITISTAGAEMHFVYRGGTWRY